MPSEAESPLGRTPLKAAALKAAALSQQAQTAWLTAPRGGGQAGPFQGAADPDEVAFTLNQLASDGAPRLNVRVTAAEDREDFNAKPYVAFLIACRFGEQMWTLEKRFSKFRALHEDLVALLGRDLAALLPALPTRSLWQKHGRSVREAQLRRHQLDLYLQELADLAARGPLDDVEDDAQQNLFHVMRELYKFVEFVEHVVPGKGDRALNDDDNSDEEHENESTYRNPALVLAITQVRRVREQLLDKQLACDTARQNKMLLGQQLVESLARVNQLESGLAHMSVQLEDMLCAQDQRQHEVQQQRSWSHGQDANGIDHITRTAPGLPVLAQSPTSSSAALMPLASPLAATAIAWSSRVALQRSGGSRGNRGSGFWGVPLSATSSPAAANRVASDYQRADSASKLTDEIAGVDDFASRLYGVRRKLEALKAQQFSNRRSWASLWRGTSHDYSPWKHLEKELQEFLLTVEEGEHGARARLEQARGVERAAVQTCMQITALGILKENVMLWKSLVGLAAAKRRATGQMSTLSIQGSWVSRRELSFDQPPVPILGALRTLSLSAARDTSASISPTVKECTAAASGAAPTTPARNPTEGGPICEPGCHLVQQQGSGGIVTERKQTSCEESVADAPALKPQLSNHPLSIKERMSSFVQRARTSFAGQVGPRVARESPPSTEKGKTPGVGGRGMWAAKVAPEAAGDGVGRCSGEANVAREEIATVVGDLSRAMEEGFYLMTSELEDVALSRAKTRQNIAAFTLELGQLEAEIAKVEKERDQAYACLQADAAIAWKMQERERYLSAQCDGLLLDDTDC